MLRRIGVEHVIDESDPGLVEDEPGGGELFGGGCRVLEQGRMGQCLPGQVVADDHPASQAAVVFGPVERAERP